MDKDTYLTIETNQVEHINHFHDEDRLVYKKYQVDGVSSLSELPSASINGEIYLIVNRESAEVIPLSTVVRARKGSRKATNKYYEHMSF